MRQSVGALVEAVGHLNPPASGETVCRALCEAMGRRRGRHIEFRTTSFPPGTASGLALDLGERDLVIVEKKTAPDHQVIITGHELRHLELGHCHQHLDEGSVAARLLDHDADLRGVVASVLSVAGRQTPALMERDGSRARRQQREEQAAEQYGLELAHAVQHLLADPGPERFDRDTTSGRIGAALGHPGARG
ncbi:toxin-antitoxin system, toxin component [Streptomyces sp. RerS4]|uniref:toxin-antitoxin system, toxin component n=1 Tax=Streptomyces sp. RerS4 TaxID=2942449 RepID=UPI00201BF48B|nr:toxin-antitoxin system, toxin component [Streptomyces sp. RerS4]UQX04406.1 toxin-antitoxin system, toxin component [Streptomyces sp. RerS4]